MASEDRITELEIQLAHLQRLYEQLNEVVTEQTLQADRDTRRLVELEQQVKELKQKSPGETEIDPIQEKPPHY